MGDAELDGAARKRRLDDAQDVAAYTHQVLSGYRMYADGHPSLQQLEHRLNDKLREYLATHESLALDVSATNLSAHGKALDDSGKFEPICKAIFLDGVTRIVFDLGVDLDELTRLTRVWYAAWQGVDEDHEEHSFTTRCWEEDFEHLTIVAVETFAEDGGEGEGEGRDDGDSLQTLISAMRSERLSTDAMPPAGFGVMRFTRADLVVLRQCGFDDVTADELARHDEPRRSLVEPAAAADLASLRSDLIQQTDTHVERFLHAVARLAVHGTPEEKERLAAIVDKLFWSLVERRRFAEVAREGKRLQALARKRADPTATAVSSWFQRILVQPDLLERTTALLDDAAVREDVAAWLEFVPPESMGELVALADALEDEAAVERLAQIVAASGARAPQLSQSVQGLRPVTFRPMVSSLPPPVSEPLLEEALRNPEAEIRLLALRQLGKEAVLADRWRLRGMVGDATPEIRQTAVRLLMSVRDRESVPALATLLEQQDVFGEERLTVIAALGALGGPVAASAVRAEFERQKDSAGRAACALALGRLGDEEARPLLEAAAKKLFGDAEVKRACKEALRRLDHRSEGDE